MELRDQRNPEDHRGSGTGRFALPASRTIPVHSEESLEVVEFEPDRRFVIRATLSSLPGQIGYTLSPNGNATTVTNTVELQPPLTLSLVAPLAAHRIKSAVVANLDVLKRTLERA